VLLDFDYSKAARRVGEHCPEGKCGIQELIDHSPLLFEFETGRLTPESFYQQVQSASGFQKEIDVFCEMFSNIFSPIPGMIELQKRLKSKGVPTYIFSNTNTWAISHIRQAYPFFGNFDGYILSYEHGSMKPDEHIYDIVEAHAGLRGAEILYIDDRADNIGTGKARGWNTIHHSDPIATISAVERYFPAIVS
jgi:HAD superfamily hydrolase (TIGR01509 family)